MNTLAGTNPWWAAVVMVVVPMVIIGAAELDERLRQRETPLRRAVTIVRNVALPSFAIWTVTVAVLGWSSDSALPVVVATLLLVSMTAATLVVLKVVLDGVADRRRAAERPVPQLVLAAPRFVVVLVAAWLLVSAVWGVDLSSALAALGVTSLVISFALQDTLGGLASGLLLLSDQPFEPGDWIRNGEIEGEVLDLNWRTTRVRNRQGDTVVVPNSQLSGASIVNFGHADGRHRVEVDVQVAFSNPPTLAKAMLLDAARSTPGVLDDPEPYVAVVKIDDPLMTYQVHLWIEDYAIQPEVVTDFGSLVWYQSHRHGVPLPSPAQDLFLFDGVAAAEADHPTHREMREIVSQTPMLASLRDDEVDRLIRASRLERFSVGEVMVDARSATRDLMVIAEGTAAVRLVESDGTQTTVDELGIGETVSLLGDAPLDGARLRSTAIDDCEILVIDAAIAADIGSRHAEVAAAFNRVVTLRRRRVERLLEQRAGDPEGGS